MTDKHDTRPLGTSDAPEQAAPNASANGNGVTPETLKTALRADAPAITTEEKRTYAKRLLKHALAQRDTDAAQTVARAMDADPELDAALQPVLERALTAEPDNVYSFMRARLSQDTSDDKWRERLKTAALAALQVAITDGDDETVINWLKLIAREPESYGLNEVVHHGIFAAAERAHESTDLARALTQIVVKYDPAALHELLEDDAFVAMLPADLRTALLDGEGDPVALIQAYGVDIYLFAAREGARKQRTDLFTASAIEQIWTAQSAGDGRGRAANALITTLKEQPLDWLPVAPLTTLLALALRDQRDDLFHKLMHQAAKRPDVITLLVNAIIRAERTPNDVLALVAQVLAVGDMTQQQAADVYTALLDAWEWRSEALDTAEQLARTLTQAPHVEIRAESLWHMLILAANEKSELVGRTALRRLSADLEVVEEDATLIEDVVRLNALIGWSASLKAQFSAWWRGFVREQPIARLQRLDKALAESGDGKKSGADELRSIVQTLLAFRRMMGKRTIQEFAADISTAYAVLGALAESFDPSFKRVQSSIDPATLRAELDARREDLSSSDQKILANNFKELALLVTTMAENRSKATLIRRNDEVDRSLMSGEQPPHSAVDALKWLAGYLSGTQERPDDDGE